MNTGQLNQKIAVFTEVYSKDGYGGTIPNLISYWETSANVKPYQAFRGFEANQVKLASVLRCTVRYRRDKTLKDSMLVKYRGSWFIIQNFTPDLVKQDFVTFDMAVYDSSNLIVGTPSNANIAFDYILDFSFTA